MVSGRTHAAAEHGNFAGIAPLFASQSRLNCSATGVAISSAPSNARWPRHIAEEGFEFA
jgi:hypothetical protein